MEKLESLLSLFGIGETLSYTDEVLRFQNNALLILQTIFSGNISLENVEAQNVRK